MNVTAKLSQKSVEFIKSYRQVPGVSDTLFSVTRTNGLTGTQTESVTNKTLFQEL